MTAKRMSEKNIRLAVIEALVYCKKFVPENYGPEYRDEMIGEAWKLVDENYARWEYTDHGVLTFTLK